MLFEFLAIQKCLRPELTRGKNISKESIQEFIKSLDVISDEDKSTLLALTPSGYIGLAGKIVEDEL